MRTRGRVVWCSFFIYKPQKCIHVMSNFIMLYQISFVPLLNTYALMGHVKMCSLIFLSYVLSKLSCNLFSTWCVCSSTEVYCCVFQWLRIRWAGMVNPCPKTRPRVWSKSCRAASSAATSVSFLLRPLRMHHLSASATSACRVHPATNLETRCERWWQTNSDVL